MNDRVLVFDVETPNRHNDRICSIGLCEIENGEIINKYYYLVNPESYFDEFNISLTGISPEMVSNQLTFDKIWTDVEDLFKTSLIVAHNACFDLCVLEKTLNAYGIEGFPVLYVDTLEIAKLVSPTKNYKLGTLCEHYNITLDAHNALSDCLACGELFNIFHNSITSMDSYIKRRNLAEASTSGKFAGKSQLTDASRSILNLLGILEGITCDDVLTAQEVAYLQEWLFDNKPLAGNYPYDKIYSIINNALEDGILTEDELNTMLNLFKQISHPVECYSHTNPNISPNGKRICLSGEFDYGTKNDVSEYIIRNGGIIVSGVSKKTDIVLIGNKGNDAWVAGNYGTKVKKALEMQEQGISIALVKELDLIKE